MGSTSVGIAAVCDIVALTYTSYHRKKMHGAPIRQVSRHHIDPKLVRIFDVKGHGGFGEVSLNLTGRIENNSAETIQEVIFHAVVRDASGVLDEGDCWASFDILTAVPPKETHSFSAFCPGIKLPSDRPVRRTFSIKSVEATQP